MESSTTADSMLQPSDLPLSDEYLMVVTEARPDHGVLPHENSGLLLFVVQFCEVGSAVSGAAGCIDSTALKFKESCR